MQEPQERIKLCKNREESRNKEQIAYRTRGISNTVTNMMSGIFAGVSNRAVLQIGWCFK